MGIDPSNIHRETFQGGEAVSVAVEIPTNTLRCSLQGGEVVVVAVEIPTNTLRCSLQGGELVFGAGESPTNTPGCSLQGGELVDVAVETPTHMSKSHSSEGIQTLLGAIKITGHINQSVLRIETPGAYSALVQPFLLLLCEVHTGGLIYIFSITLYHIILILSIIS